MYCHMNSFYGAGNSKCLFKKLVLVALYMYFCSFLCEIWLSCSICAINMSIWYIKELNFILFYSIRCIDYYCKEGWIGIEHSLCCSLCLPFGCSFTLYLQNCVLVHHLCICLFWRRICLCLLCMIEFQFCKFELRHGFPWSKNYFCVWIKCDDYTCINHFL